MTDQSAPDQPTVYRYKGTVDDVVVTTEPAAFPTAESPEPVSGPVPADPPVTHVVPRQTLGSIPPRDLTQTDVDGLSEYDREQLLANVASPTPLYAASTPAKPPQAPAVTIPPQATPAADAQPQKNVVAQPPAQT